MSQLTTLPSRGVLPGPSHLFTPLTPSSPVLLASPQPPLQVSMECYGLTAWTSFPWTFTPLRGHRAQDVPCRLCYLPRSSSPSLSSLSPTPRSHICLGSQDLRPSVSRPVPCQGLLKLPSPSGVKPPFWLLKLKMLGSPVVTLLARPSFRQCLSLVASLHL